MDDAGDQRLAQLEGEETMGAMKMGMFAAKVADRADRVNRVRQEPAVKKSFDDVLHDSRQLAKSMSTFALETRAAWRSC